MSQKRIGVLLLGDSIRCGYQQKVAETMGEDYAVFGPDDNCRFAKYMLNYLRSYLSDYAKHMGEVSRKVEAVSGDGEKYGAPSSEADVLIGEKPDVIHWNVGLWDTAVVYEEDGAFTPVEEYVSYCAKILHELRKITPNIIFALTTPVRKPNLNEDNDIIIGHNRAVLEYMQKEGIMVNDLYSLIDSDKDRYLAEDNIHLSAEGYQVCADAIKACIERIL